MRREYSYNIMKENHRFMFVPYVLFCEGVIIYYGLDFYWTYLLSIFMMGWVAIWAIYIMKMRVYIDDEGITVKHPYRTISFRWDEIASMERKYYYSRTLDGEARDIRILTKSGRRMKLYYFIRDEQGNEGIEIIEPELIKHTNLKVMPFRLTLPFR